MAQYNEAEVIAAMEAGKITRRSLYIEDHESFGRFMLSGQIRKPVAEVAEQIRLVAIGDTRKRTGDLASGYRVKINAGTIVVNDAHPSARVKVEVFNSDEAAAPMEFGNSRVGKPGRRALGRAGALFGDWK